MRILSLFAAAMLLSSFDANAQFGAFKSKLPTGGSDKKASLDSLPNPAETKVFNKHKENVVQCYDFLNKFSNSNNDQEVAGMCDSVLDVIELAEETVKEVKDGISDLGEFQKKNDEAQKILLKSKIGMLESTYIPKAKDRLEGIKISTLKSIKRDADWLASPEAKVQYASSAMDEINAKFAMLDKLFDGDKDVKAAKKTELPRAKKNYEALLKQVEKMRMPASKYSGGDKKSLEKTFAALYVDRYSGSDVKRVVITGSGWASKTVLDDGRWITYEHLAADVAVAKGNVCTVYTLTFHRRGGKVELGSIGSNYPVMMANVNK